MNADENFGVVAQCLGCGDPIPTERLEAIPGTKTCVRCSPAVRVLGRMVYAHKTAPVIELLTPAQASLAAYHESQRQQLGKGGSGSGSRPRGAPNLRGPSRK